MIDLLELAPRGRWQSGKLIDAHNAAYTSDLPWNGNAGDTRGFVRPIYNARCEDGHVNRVLEMHPRWGPQGTIKGWLPWTVLPDNAVFKAEIGFLHGALGTDGASFQVWEHHYSPRQGGEVWNRVLCYRKDYSGELVSVEGDLSHLSGQRVGMELRVDAGPSSGRDWAVWVDPQIESREGPAAGIWTVRPVSLVVRSRNERRRLEGRGDEPYLAGLYFRSSFGKAGTTKTAALDTLKTLGSNLQRGERVAIADDAEMAVSDVATAWPAADVTALINGVTVMGVGLVAMEADRRGKGRVRDQLRDTRSKLHAALVEHVESSWRGILEPGRILERIEDDVLGAGSHGRRLGDVFREVLGWLGRADDFVGDNMLVVVGLEEIALRDRLGARYRPSAREDPVSALTEQDFTLDFRGSGAHYTVDVELRPSDADILVR